MCIIRLCHAVTCDMARFTGRWSKVSACVWQAAAEVCMSRCRWRLCMLITSAMFLFGPFDTEKGDLLLRGVGTPRYLFLTNCICAVAAWWLDNPHQKVVPMSRIPRSSSHLSYRYLPILTVFRQRYRFEPQSLDAVLAPGDFWIPSGIVRWPGEFWIPSGIICWPGDFWIPSGIILWPGDFWIPLGIIRWHGDFKYLRGSSVELGAIRSILSTAPVQGWHAQHLNGWRPYRGRHNTSWREQEGDASDGVRGLVLYGKIVCCTLELGTGHVLYAALVLYGHVLDIPCILDIV